MLIFENLKLALSAIRINKMRSFLTMLGMIIGISSVISIVSIGDTMRNVMAEQYKAVGSGLAYVYISSENGYYSSSETFTLDDIEKIENTFKDNIDYHVTTRTSFKVNVSNGRNSSSVSAIGIQDGYEKVTPTVKLIKGRMIDENDQKGEKMNIVLEETTVNELFGNNEPLGQKVKVLFDTGNGKETKEMNVVGIYKSEKSPIMKLLMGTDIKEAFVAESILTSPNDSYFSPYFYKNNATNSAVFKERITNYIARIKNVKPENVLYYSAEEEIGTIDNIMSGLSAAVGAIAAISLVVGGIGIMNIMLVSVTERTREIGIRKALGARTKDILMQFLIESAIISAVGGIIGTLLGAGVVMIGGSIVKVAVVIKPQIVIGAVVFSAVVGIFFGIYPALKAARKDPIEALRYE